MGKQMSMLVTALPWLPSGYKTWNYRWLLPSQDIGAEWPQDLNGFIILWQLWLLHYIQRIMQAYTVTVNKWWNSRLRVFLWYFATKRLWTNNEIVFCFWECSCDTLSQKDWTNNETVFWESSYNTLSQKAKPSFALITFDISVVNWFVKISLCPSCFVLCDLV